MADEIDFGALSSVKKVSGMIPIGLFEEIQRRGLFGDGWDIWLSQAIHEKIKKDCL